MDMICFMHEGSPYGHLKVKDKVILPPNLARMCGLTLQETEGYLAELHEAGVYDTDEAGCIYSRRMIRDENLRNARAAGGKKGGNPNLEGGKVNLDVNLEVNHKVGKEVKQKPTPSSSSSSSSSNDSNGEGLEVVWQEPTREQVIEAGRKCKLTEQQAEIWLNETLARPIDRWGRWTDRNGNPIDRWQHALAAWAGRFHENNKPKGSTNGSNGSSGRERLQRYRGVGDPSHY